MTAAAVLTAVDYGTHRPPSAPMVTTAAVTRSDVVEVVDATGTLQAVTIPETVRSGSTDVATLGFIGGFAVMMALDNALG